MQVKRFKFPWILTVFGLPSFELFRVTFSNMIVVKFVTILIAGP